MGRSLQNLYKRLPYPGRVSLATARGAQLQRWRYGAETDHLVAAAVARESWSVERWQRWQQERLVALLDHARWSVPYYRLIWDARRCGPEGQGWRELTNWPVLTKDHVREQPHSFLTDTTRSRRMFEDHTSGTTGSPLRVWLSRSTVRQCYALFEARLRRWNGFDRHDRWATLGGQLVAPASQRRPPYWVWNAAAHQLYMSVFHISERTASAYADALNRHRIRYLLGYPSAISSLAIGMQASGVRPPALDAVLTNAEPLLDWQRQRIESVFRCPVRTTYGMAEVVAAGSECHEGTLHSWPELGLTEVLDEVGDPVVTGRPGRLVCTGLLNRDMPLIRYEVGDRGALSPSARPCGCGRLLPRWEVIEGRSDDMIITRDGRRVGRLDGIFKADLPLREAQIVQDSLDRIRVRCVPEGALDPAVAAAVEQRVRERVPGVAVTLEEVTGIERDGNGKFRAVISNVVDAGA